MHFHRHDVTGATGAQRSRVYTEVRKEHEDVPSVLRSQGRVATATTQRTLRERNEWRLYRKGRKEYKDVPSALKCKDVLFTRNGLKTRD